MKRLLIFSFLFLLIDQITKTIVISFFDVNHGLVIIPSFFSILYVKNYGAAFSIMQNMSYLLVSISFIAIILIFIFVLKNKMILKKYDWLAAILIGGIVGNLVDRLFRGHVVDFLAFEIFGHPMPIFNFADIFIVCSALYMTIFIDWSEYDENKS